MELKEALLSLKKAMDDFLERTVKKEEEESEVDQKIGLLENIVLGKSKDFWQIKDRFKGMETWLKNEGVEINSRKVKKNQIQKVIECIERMKIYGEMIRGERFYQDGENTLKRANLFIRENLRRRGWEYTPLGLVDFVQLDESLLNLKDEIRNLDQDDTDLKNKYQKTLSYQLDLMDYFYKPKDHLLTILDYQLKTLEMKTTKEDEFFTASLIYYLRQNRYKVEPYLERFRKILNQKKSLN
ncbi:MAG: hypothetical protein A2W07_04820 [candidate division Zixibacteria bacterium RBG_16_43_9]|nr:MAG: hypothetical protein A2W07_04820 [candidate division Zixibacteria bacterium RBG_16_43_9]